MKGYHINEPAFPVSTALDAAGQAGHQDGLDRWQFPGLSQRDYIATHLPATPGGIDVDAVFLITGKQITLDTPPLDQVRFAAQAEAKLRYIRADAMLAARGEV